LGLSLLAAGIASLATALATGKRADGADPPNDHARE
jgi:hypothetical protein